jgi:hypothetical protein
LILFVEIKKDRSLVSLDSSYRRAAMAAWQYPLNTGNFAQNPLSQRHFAIPAGCTVAVVDCGTPFETCADGQ